MRASKGVWGHPPRRFSNLKALKRHFQHSQADSCVKMVPKLIVTFFLNFGKRSVVISCIIFSSHPLYCSQNTILVTYEGAKSAQCIFMFCSFTLRESRCKLIGEFAAKCLIWKCLKATKPSDRTGQQCYVILFCSSCVIHHDYNSEFTWISK